jgi:nitroreductase
MDSARPDDLGAAAAAFEALLAQRYSCRGFLPDEIPRGTIVRILELAQRTPSWCNAQPWQVTITSGAATARLSAALCRHAAANAPAPDLPFPSEYRGVYLDRRRVCGLQLYRSVGIARGDAAAARRQLLENYRMFGAPHVAIVTTDAALGTYAAIDCGAYVGNFMLAARSLGVAAIAQAALASYPAVLRSELAIPDGRLVVCGVSFGREDRAHPANQFRTERTAVDEVVTWVDA